MKLRMALRSKILSSQSKLTFYLYKDIDVLSEKMPKSVLMVIAEVGGYIGLTLGVSLPDMKTVVSTLWIIVNSKLDRIRTDIENK